MSTLLGWVIGSRILVYPVGHCYNSLLLDMEKLSFFLTTQGHNVTMIINNEYNGTKSDIDMSLVSNVQFPAPTGTPTMCDMEKLLARAEASMYDIVDIWMSSTLSYCDALLSSNILPKLKAENYNLLIFDQTDWCSAIIADYLKIPFIRFASVNTAFTADELWRYMHVPAIFVPYGYHMTTVERAINSLAHLGAYFSRNIVLRPMQQLKTDYKISPSTHLTDVYDRSAAIFLNSDPLVDYPRPTFSHEISVGFLFAGISSKNVPQKFTDFIGDNNDIVLVCFGTQVSHGWDDAFDKTILSLPYKVIWRNGAASNLTNESSNILIQNWIPQPALLASGRVRLLITHGGVASTMEAIYNGVPMIIIPMQAEQVAQATKISNHLKVARTFDITKMKDQSLSEMIHSMMGETEERIKIRKLSFQARNQIDSTKDTILRWINTVTSDWYEAPNYSQDVYRWFGVDILLSSVLSLFIIFVFLIHISLRINRYILTRLKFFLFIQN